MGLVDCPATIMALFPTRRTRDLSPLVHMVLIKSPGEMEKYFLNTVLKCL